jgi:hypothetical protein
MRNPSRFLLFFLWLVFFSSGLAAFAPWALAQSNEDPRTPWDKMSLQVGYFITTTNTSLRFGSGIGIEIEAEEFLGLDTTSDVFRVDGYWRFTKSRRHRIDLSWFSLNRSGQRVTDQDFVIEDPEGNEITIPAGSSVDAFFNLDIYKAEYSYSFFQDDRFDLAVVLGLYVMPIEAGFSSTGFIDYDLEEDFTAPLPVIGLRSDIALTPKWFVRSGFQVLYLEIDRFEGAIFQANAALEYLPWKHVGIGLGFDLLHLEIEAEGKEDYPGIDLRGNIEFTYAGLSVYGKVYF